MSKITYIIFFLFLNWFGFSQNKLIDSLEKEVSIAKQDTTKISLLLQLAGICQPTEILKYANPANELADKLLLKYTSPSKEKDKILEYKAHALNEIGYMNNNLGNISKAFDCYSKSLKIYETLNNKMNTAYLLSNLAFIYIEQKDINKGLDYYNRGLNILEDINDTVGIATVVNCIGSIYRDLGNFSKAMNYYNRSLKINEALKNKVGISATLNDIGLLLMDKGDIYKALDFFQKSLKLAEEMDDKQGRAISLNYIGRIYLNQKKYKIAYPYIDSSLAISRQLGYPVEISGAEHLLSEIDKGLGNYKSAFDHYKQYILYRDSVKSMETQKASIQNQLKYEFEKKEEKERLITEEKQRFQQTIMYSVGIGLLLVIIFSIFIFISLQQNKKANKIITLQKEEVEVKNHIIEEKHKEITDSINYAERIQRALLASKKLLDENLKDYFIFFQPKDVVSGDFYWATRLVGSSGVENFVLVTADSTGHGVPGAIMSIVNIASLKEAVTQGITSPELLLNETRRLVIENLKNDGSAEGGKDGMDASLLSFDFKNNTLYCACANNPIWVVRGEEFIEIKADRMPIGKHEKDTTSFNLNTLQLEKGDIVYTLTDGFADQFGGTNGKKFKYKQLQELLLSMKHESMLVQKQKLNDIFNHWKGNLEQVDDVCLIGIRI